MNDNDDNEEEAFTEEKLIEAIENQIAADDPPAAKATCNKLTLVGYPRDEILQMMALVLAQEISAMLDANRPFDRDGYELALRRLPELPEDASGNASD